MPDNNITDTYIIRILKEIYTDKTLRVSLGFKGGTAIRLFYGLPRFSSDLDFDQINENVHVISSLQKLISRFGPVTVYEKNGETILVVEIPKIGRKIKIKVIRGRLEDGFELKNYLGIPVMAMKKDYLAAQKILAFWKRPQTAIRDLFDIWYLLSHDWKINRNVVEKSLKTDLHTVLETIVHRVEKIRPSALKFGLGELGNETTRDYISKNLKNDLIFNINLYKHKISLS